MELPAIAFEESEWIRGTQPSGIVGVYLAAAPAGWARTARELSKRTGGQWQKGGSCAVWQYGRKTTWIVDSRKWDDVLSARMVCEEFGAKPGATVGGCARNLLRAVGSKDNGKIDPLLLDWDGWAYHDCFPGRYDSATLWDAESCYFALLSRAPSLKVEPLPSGLMWCKMEDREWSRWQELLSLVGYHKLLRNSLVGAAQGKLGHADVYVKGRKVKAPARPGPYPNLAVLVVRTGYELCREAAQETDSVYSCVDSVMSTDSAPGAWKRVGLSTRAVSTGPAEVCCYGVYRCGAKSTQYYRMGYRLNARRARRTEPRFIYYREWL